MLQLLLVVVLFMSKTSTATILGDVASLAAGSINRYVHNKLTTADIQEIYKPVFTDILTKVKELSCMRGLYSDIDSYDTTLLLINGRLSPLEDVKMRVSVPRDDGEETVVTEVIFIFQKINIKFDFFYSDYRVFFHVDREGDMQFEQDGPIILKFMVQFPKSKDTVDQLMDKKSCAASIIGYGTNLNQKTLEILQFNYESLGTMFSIRVTEAHVRSVIEGIEDDIQQNIEAVLLSVIEPAFRRYYVNCRDGKYKPPKPEEIQRLSDCEEFRTAGKED